MTYAEYLAECGASADEIKILDTAVARKAFERQLAKVAEADAEKQKAADLIKRNQTWATEVETQNQQYLKERDTAQVEAAAATARLKKMQELGLIEVAEKLEPGSTKTEPVTAPGVFDPKLLEPYVTRETLLQVAEKEGDAIAIAQDISFEHQQLFGNDPTKRLNFRDLRREAVARKIPVEALWMEKYNVQAARDAAAAKAQAERDRKIAEEAVTKYKSEHSATNPLTAVPTISRSPFTERPASAGMGDKRVQPWQRPDAEKENARLSKVLPNLEKQGLLTQ